jgi:hypothetical protein
MYYFISDPIYKVQCSPNEMLVEIVDTDESNNVYLQHLKKYPGKIFHTSAFYNRKNSIYAYKTINILTQERL